MGRPGHSRSQSFDHTSEKSTGRNRANSAGSSDSYALTNEPSDNHTEDEIPMGSYKSMSRLETIDEVSLSSEQMKSNFATSSPVARPGRSSTVMSAQSASSVAYHPGGNASPAPSRSESGIYQGPSSYIASVEPSFRTLAPTFYHNPENKLLVGM